MDTIPAYHGEYSAQRGIRYFIQEYRRAEPTVAGVPACRFAGYQWRKMDSEHLDTREPIYNTVYQSGGSGRP